MQNTVSPEVAASMLLIGLLFMFLSLVVVVVVIAAYITTWQLYRKAGERGWAALIPGYSGAVMAKIAKLPIWFGITAEIFTIASFFTPDFPQDIDLGLSVTNSGSASLYATGILTLIGLIGFGMTIYMIVKLSKYYNRGPWFWVGYIVLPVITLFQLSKTKYLPQGKLQAPKTTNLPAV